MGREIKFRALKDDMSNCNFVYGQLVYDAAGNLRISAVDNSGQGLTFHTCIKGTESQYTGLKDSKGKEIYEGDVRREEIEYEEGDETIYFVCTWIKELAMFSWLTVPEYIEYTDKDSQAFDIIFPTENPYPLDITEIQHYIVCGNVFENPRLLEPIPHK